MENQQTNAQQLAFAEKLTFSTADFTIVKQLKQRLETLGFYFEALENNEIEVNAIPSELSKENLQGLFEDFLEQEKNEENIENSSNIGVAKVLAKSMAIKTGKKLDQEEMRILLSNLMQCKNPTICPKGNKIIMNMGLTSILKQF